MAKGKARPHARSRRTARNAAGTRKSGSRPKTRTASARRPQKKTVARGSAGRKNAPARGTRKATAARRRKATPLGPPLRAGLGTRTKTPRLDRVRRTLEEPVQTPPSSLDMDRRGSAARTGRRGLADSLEEHAGMTPAITGGDVDADWEDAYFTGDEAPGGDNPTPDQDIVDDIGKSLGVEYQDNEELKSSDKVTERDKHRWELDPASSEDYKERD